VLVCLAYALLLLKGSWDYWAPYANLPPTEGRWFPTGLSERFSRSGLVRNTGLPVPFFLRWLEDVFNDGEAYEKLPKVVPYVVLPVSMALLVWRFAQAGLRILRGQQELLIVSHEAEDDVAEAAKKLKEHD
jgi:C4-dicarboxylate transporter DctQ subunit